MPPLSISLLLAAVLFPAPAAAKAQEATPAAPAAQEGDPAETPTPMPKLPVPPPPASTAPGRPIRSIHEHRGYETSPYVRRWEDVRKLDLSRVDFDAPVVARVNDRDVTRDEFRVWQALLTGQNGINRAQVAILIQKMIEKAVAQGVDPATYAVSDADIEARLRQEEADSRAQGEEALATYRERIDSILGFDRYRKWIHAHLVAEKVLLPPVPAKPAPAEGEAPADPAAAGGDDDAPMGLPLESAELLEDQPQIRDYLNDAYVNGTEIPALFRTQFLKMLQEKMIDMADIRLAIEEPLPPGVFMTVEGEAVAVDDVLAFAPHGRLVQEGALRLLLLYRAVDDVLRDNDSLLSKERFAELYEAHEAEYRGTLFQVKTLSQLRGFPSIADYREYWKRRFAFQEMVKDTVTEDVLREHHSKYGRFFYEMGRADAELVFASLTETEEQNGVDEAAAWQVSRERAEAARAAFEAGEEAASIQERFSDPLPTHVASLSIDRRARNDLRMALGETEYVIFQNGYSLADDVIYNRAEGDLIGPVRFAVSNLPGIRNTLGWYVAKVTKYTHINDIKDFDSQRPMVTTDYYDLRFVYFTHECLKNAKIELTES